MVGEDARHIKFQEMEIHSRNKNPNQVFSGFARRRQPILKTECPHQTPLRPTRSIDAMVVMEIKYDIPWLKKGDDFLMTFCVLAIHFPSFSISSLRFPIVFFFCSSRLLSFLLHWFSRFLSFFLACRM